VFPLGRAAADFSGERIVSARVSRPVRRTQGSSQRSKAPTRSQSDAPGVSLDGGVLTAALVLASLGVIMSYSATAPLSSRGGIPPLFLDHLTGLVIGIAVAAAAMWLPLAFWRRVAIPLWAFGVVLLGLTWLTGVEVNGAQRWLAIPGTGFRFQPVEVAKCGTLLAVAVVAGDARGGMVLSGRRTLVAAALVGPPVALLLMQPDLGNAVLLSLLVGLMLLVAGTSLRTLGVAAVAAVAGIVYFVTTHPYALRRVMGFVDPYADPEGTGFQLVQSFVAFGHGGLVGVGIGSGWQKLFYLPEAHTDFVLALVAEELGLLGVLLVLGAFTALLIAGTRIARRARSRFALLVAFSVTALLTLPAIVNSGVVMGLLPTKGLTLPFLSYGRTSLVVSCAAVGLLLGIARRQDQGEPRVTPARPGRLAWR
jgi:cell division protein FtsW